VPVESGLYFLVSTQVNMAFRKIFTYVILLIGSLCVMVGLAFSAMYLYGAVIAPWGEADQSLLFWHLPILFFGIFSVILGLAMTFWGINRIRFDDTPRDP